MSIFLYREGFRELRSLGFFFNKVFIVKVKYFLNFVGMWLSVRENIVWS